MKMALIPPQKPPSFHATPTSIREDIIRLISQSRKVQDEIAKIQPNAATFANVVLPLAHAENVLNLESHVLVFYKAVSPDPDIRAASREVQNLLDDFKVETAMREDVFRLVDIASRRQNNDLSEEDLYFLEKKHSEFIRNGLQLDGAERDQFKKIKSHLSHLRDEFLKNIADSSIGTGVWFTPEELDGVPRDVLSGFEEGDWEHRGQLRVSFREHHYFPILKYARNAGTRKRYLIANANQEKCVQNIPILKEAIVLRDEAARLLGYPNHASFRLQNMMAKDPETVNKFLEDLESRLSEGGKKEVRALKEIKKKDLESRGEVFDGQYFLWDHSYYDRMMLEAEYSIDHQKIAEYFPLQTTLIGLLDIFQQLFGLRFDKVDTIEHGMSKGDVWHEDVQMFNVWDDEGLGDGFVGFLYLDLFPRDGKYGYASSFNLVPVSIESRPKTPELTQYRGSFVKMAVDNTLQMRWCATSPNLRQRHPAF
jgi:metallopeptidase MepB